MKGWPLLGALVLLGAWSIVSGFSLVDRLFLATPWDIAGALIRLSISGRLFYDLSNTLLRSTASLFISMLIGIPAGLAIGWSKRLRDYFNFPLEFLRVLPAPALFPLFMVLFGIDNMAKIASCVFACLFPIIVQTAYGVIQGNRRRMILVERMGFNKTQLLFKVVFPQALPYVFVGLRNALSLSLLATIVVEMTMPGRAGLGYSILSAYQVFRIPEMYAYIIVAGILGWVMNKLFVVFERRQLHWVGR